METIQVDKTLDFSKFTFDPKPFALSSQYQQSELPVVFNEFMQARLTDLFYKNMPYILGVAQDTNKTLHLSDGVALYTKIQASGSPDLTKVFYYHYWPACPRKWSNHLKFELLDGWFLINQDILKTQSQTNVEKYLSTFSKAEKGDPNAMHQMGTFFEDGLEYVIPSSPWHPTSLSNKMYWYKKAAEQGYHDAIRRIIDLLGSGCCAEECQELLDGMLAKLKGVESFENLRLLGHLYQGIKWPSLGKGDMDLSIKYFEKAADMNDNEAWCVCDHVAGIHTKNQTDKQAFLWSVKGLKKRDDFLLRGCKEMTALIQKYKHIVPSFEMGKIFLILQEYSMAISCFIDALELARTGQHWVKKIDEKTGTERLAKELVFVTKEDKERAKERFEKGLSLIDTTEIEAFLKMASRRQSLLTFGYDQKHLKSTEIPSDGAACYEAGLVAYYGKDKPQDMAQALYLIEEAATLGCKEALQFLENFFQEHSKTSDNPREETTEFKEHVEKKQKS